MTNAQFERAFRSEVLKILRDVGREERGKAKSELDNVYRRGYRQALRSVRTVLEERQLTVRE